MTPGHRIRAVVDLATVAEGGLKGVLPSGTRALLLQFPDGGQEPVTLGAELTLEDGAELSPGTTGVTIVALFWADEARNVARPGRQFVLWYGRAVGRGHVLEVPSD